MTRAPGGYYYELRTARKPHWCEMAAAYSCRIERGQRYRAAIAFPHSDANGGDTPWRARACLKHFDVTE